MAEYSWIDDEIAVSGAISDKDIPALKDTGIDAIVDLRSEYRDNEKLIKKSGIRFLHIKIDDGHNPDFNQLEKIFNFAESVLDRGKKILIHCQNGCGRAPLVAVAILAKRGMNIPDAVGLVKDKHPWTGFSKSQEKFIYMELDKFLKSRSAQRWKNIPMKALANKSKVMLFAIILVGLPLSRAEATVIGSVPQRSIIVDGRTGDWDAAGIVPLAGLNWKTMKFGKVSEEEAKRIKSVRIAHDGENLFLLLEIKSGVKQYLDEKQGTGHIGYIYLDADGSESTGERIKIDNKYGGWDYRIYLPIGFSGSTDASEVRPLASYEVERIVEFISEKVKYGYTYHIECEDIAGGNKSSNADPTYISFKGDFLEMRFPFKMLRMSIPTKIGLIIEDLSAFSDVEAEIHAVLKK